MPFLSTRHCSNRTVFCWPNDRCFNFTHRKNIKSTNILGKQDTNNWLTLLHVVSDSMRKLYDSYKSDLLWNICCCCCCCEWVKWSRRLNVVIFINSSTYYNLIEFIKLNVQCAQQSMASEWECWRVEVLIHMHGYTYRLIVSPLEFFN